MGKARPVTAAGRARVERAFERHGLLLVQGQWEVPSIADLLRGRPMLTRGYSWDYVPAWQTCDALAERADVQSAKLFRGRRTLVSKKLWPALDALAREAAVAVRQGRGGREQRRVLEIIEATPGIPGGEIKSRLLYRGKQGSRSFLRAKSDLEKWLCIEGVERDDLDYHTHESLWFPWTFSSSARALARRKTRPSMSAATESLLLAVFPEGPSTSSPRPEVLFPVLRLLRSS